MNGLFLSSAFPSGILLLHFKLTTLKNGSSFMRNLSENAGVNFEDILYNVKHRIAVNTLVIHAAVTVQCKAQGKVFNCLWCHI